MLDPRNCIREWRTCKKCKDVFAIKNIQNNSRFCDKCTNTIWHRKISKKRREGCLCFICGKKPSVKKVVEGKDIYFTRCEKCRIKGNNKSKEWRRQKSEC